MTQVNSHSRALIEVDDIDISQIPAGTKRGTISMLDGIAFATRPTVIEQAIKDIRKYQDRMSIDGRAIQHIADSLEELLK